MHFPKWISVAWENLSRRYLAGGFAWMSFALIAAIAFLLSIGPDIQISLFALVNSDNPSIYESSYQTDLIKWPNLSTWLAQAINAQFWLEAAAIYLISFYTRSFRSIVHMLALSTFLVTAIVDVSILTILGPRNFDEFFQNIVADFIGGIALAFFVAIILAACEYVCRSFSDRSRFLGIWLSGGVAIIVGILTSTAAFYIFDFFYRPLPVRLELALDYPSGGTIIADPTDPRPVAQFDGTKATRQPFSFAPNVSQGAEVEWESPQGPTKLQWKALGTPAKFDVELVLFGGCWDLAKAKAVSQRTGYVLSNVRAVDLWVDGGVDRLSVDRSGEVDDELSFTHQRVSLFSTARGQEKDAVDFQQFVAGKAALEIRTSDPGLSYYAATTAFSIDNDVVTNKAKTLHLVVDGKETLLQLKTKAGSLKGSEPLVCRQLSAGAAVSRSSVDMDSIGGLLGILVKASAVPGSAHYLTPTQSLEVNAESGWITLKGLKTEALGQLPPTHAEMIAVGHGVHSVKVNQEADKVLDTDDYVAVGNLDGAYDNNGRIHFTGTADLLWRNSARANPTKWESTTEARGRLIAIAVAAFSFLTSIFALRFKNNGDLSM
ncbi:hypothetical protein FJ970_30520 [Mesorhizobium sp. B2-1-8]|uniref:hypothetical protein n=1 Tax=Mesorhizobium sp. B2-1-8 TaxID=2589967 RepID=UPI001129E1D2|nr:hypothetical protein [Mesorhizobium sp. B2-1-8]UCI19289.1 hypothetical protein FJ970_30520 [Mesorhizobium sp. B2-1-8]